MAKQEFATNTCDSCGETYNLTRDNSNLNLYQDPICNHIIMKCSSGHYETIFVTWDRVRMYAYKYNLLTNIIAITPPGLVARAKQAWARVNPEPEAIEAAPPKDPAAEWRSPRLENYITRRQKFLGYLIEHNKFLPGDQL